MQKILFLVTLVCMVAVGFAYQDMERVYVPEDDPTAKNLDKRKAEQLKSVGQFKVFHGFSFSDQIEKSGITFVHQVTEDNKKEMKPVHYDHGNGLAIADVDNDGLYDIYFMTQLGSNELWKNLGNGKFRDITKEAGVGLPQRICVGAAFADVDNDGDQDLFVTTVRMTNAYFENDGTGKFTDKTNTIKLGYEGHSSAPFFFDFNNDGVLDCFLANVGNYTINRRGEGGYYVGRRDAFLGHMFPKRNETNILYQNVNGVMKDVSKEMGIQDLTWSGDGIFTDINNDGYQDLYVLNMQGDDRFYINNKGQGFEEKTDAYFPKTSWGAMSGKFFDYNNDGLLDLVVTDMHSDMSQDIGEEMEYNKADIKYDPKILQGEENNLFGNSFYKNLGNGKFEEVSDKLGVENYWPWGVTVADLNADGYQDMFFASSMSFPFRYGVNSVFLNNQGEEFLDSEFILGVEPRKDNLTYIPWFTVDCSGPDKRHPFCRGREGLIQIMGALGTRSAAIFDLDNDGDLDIVTHEFGAKPQVLINDLAQKKKIHFLKIKLRGGKSNRDGLGALVTVTAGGKRYVQQYDGKFSYLAQSSLPLYFGLGDTARAEKVEVRWPSGTKQTIDKGIPTNDTLVITESN